MTENQGGQMWVVKGRPSAALAAHSGLATAMVLIHTQSHVQSSHLGGAP